MCDLQQLTLHFPFRKSGPHGKTFAVAGIDDQADTVSIGLISFISRFRTDDVQRRITFVQEKLKSRLQWIAAGQDPARIGLDRQSSANWLDAFLPLPRGRAERSRNRERALGALDRLGVLHVADDYPAQLPPGVLRLAEIARAIAGDPRVLLLDEPAAGLNSIETGDLSSALKRLRVPGLVLVVVEHDMDLIMDVCDTIHVLNVGRLLASGSPEEVRGNPDVVRVYLGDEDA